ncbi:RWD-domain-containing protein [Marasmius fiardii PR-910]|nr:RWD-domain-containing protein [Marasmius fiardii PR-910]
MAENMDTQHDPLQKEEWEVIESIYPDYISQNLDESGSFKLELPVEFPQSRTIDVLKDSAAGEGANDTPDMAREESLSLSLSTLPPLLLHIVLPPTYPTRTAPSLLSIRATHLWLQADQVVQLQQRLVDMWSEAEGQGVLYTWIEYLHSGEFLDHLRLIRGESIQIHHPSPRILVPLLKDHQTQSASNTFNQTSYPCSICLDYFKGSKCLELSCSHVFCRKCLQDFWGLCIKEGDIERVRCPDPECVKNGQDATEEEVARVVSGGEEELSRWRWLKEKVAIEKDPTIVHCPMAFCQKPVRKPKMVEGEEESGWDRLRTCENCLYSFCAFCKRTWHGPISACPISASETLVREYLALPENSSQRITMERRFGRKNIARLVDAYHEEQANKKWLEASTTACAGCGVSVEKSLGCNHMTCAKCKIHFCYKCGQKLNPSDPYKHFSMKGQPCYNKLFDVNSEVDMADWEFDAFDGL